RASTVTSSAPAPSSEAPRQRTVFTPSRRPARAAVAGKAHDFGHDHAPRIERRLPTRARPAMLAGLTQRRRNTMDTYYKPADLARFPEMGENAPEIGKKFFDWYGAVFADGALTAREKSLIALAVAHAVK